MTHSTLVIFGAVAWFVGLWGMVRIQAMKFNKETPLLHRLFAAIRFRVTGQDKAEIVLSLCQILGLFWIVSGVGFWLIEDQVNMASISSLILLVYVMPILILLGVSIRPK